LLQIAFAWLCFVRGKWDTCRVGGELWGLLCQNISLNNITTCIINIISNKRGYNGDGMTMMRAVVSGKAGGKWS